MTQPHFVCKDRCATHIQRVLVREGKVGLLGRTILTLSFSAKPAVGLGRFENAVRAPLLTNSGMGRWNQRDPSVN
jgi:hypothetical protein